MSQVDDYAAPVLVDEIATASGHVIGRLTLNKPKALNALDLEMAKVMLEALKTWQDKADVVAVFVDSTLEKAFCAGGDVVSMYNAMRAEPSVIPDFLQTFFAVEYELDYLIRTYTKPVVVWGAGIVMGGGMGLLCGASHRIVSPTSRLAMPEISIGLYPDVGGSYFLPRLPKKAGLFLGLTGASVNATDALALGFADYLCADKGKDALLTALVQQNWQPSQALDQQATAVISSQAPDSDVLPEANVKRLEQDIENMCGASSVSAIVENILTFDSSGDKWLSRAQQTLKAGSPITAHLVYQQYLRGINMSLEACFRMELIMSCRCGEIGEFQEGVRALLIDKDQKPHWQFESVKNVPKAVVERFFTSPWDEDAHPLARLGEQC
ncbi:enoyl-CoA hydratase/isomerase family protein [Alteromonas pelagimontana]|uniref:3-hydroxyisobutyryl-CoA hydrolase n=1 Tax=Alteromonas pelagimontana TaxID=1858656 RepID=A0A6M4MKF4_9ALTE|nr:enoyl-CoA hydratase/isomerase family protein [Alteromonas pelagimontana]QJR82556.1 enoyl-CoA hydratase/isomerase family protein [Alteromonas pelagimontana]